MLRCFNHDHAYVYEAFELAAGTALSVWKRTIKGEKMKDFLPGNMGHVSCALLAPPVGGRTAREWSRAEPRVLVYGWVARKIGKPKS